MMKITLKRMSEKMGAIDGQLEIDRKRVCDTTERASRCLPKGEYGLQLVRCPHEGTRIVVVGQAPDAGQCAECMRCWHEREAHWLEAMGDGEASPGEQVKVPCCPHLVCSNGMGLYDAPVIAVGQQLVPGVVVRTQEHYARLFDRLRKNAMRHKEAVLRIE